MTRHKSHLYSQGVEEMNQIRESFLVVQSMSCIRFRELGRLENSIRMQYIIIIKGNGFTIDIHECLRVQQIHQIYL